MRLAALRKVATRHHVAAANAVPNDQYTKF
jgi:hypothetical protein